MTVLGRDQILSANDITKELIPVPEWGGEVYVKALSAGERDGYESSMIHFNGKKQSVNMENARAKLAALSICDENGARLFTDMDVQDLTKKSAAALQRVFEVAQRLSKITDDDLEELTKN